MLDSILVESSGCAGSASVEPMACQVYSYKPLQPVSHRGLHRTGGKGRDISTAIAVVFMLMWLAASALAAIMGPDARLRQGAGAGLLISVTFISTSIGILGFLERRSIKLSAIDAGYFVVAFVVMGMILGSWH